MENLTKNIMKEIVLIARSKNITLKQDIIETSMQVAKRFPYDTTTSFQKDYFKGNNKNEEGLFGRALIRMAQEHGIAVHTIIKIYSKLIS